MKYAAGHLLYLRRNVDNMYDWIKSLYKYIGAVPFSEYNSLKREYKHLSNDYHYVMGLYHREKDKYEKLKLKIEKERKKNGAR